VVRVEQEQRRFMTPTTRPDSGAGSALTDPEARADLGDIPAHEEVVVLPWSLLESYARQRR
jgi:hypothetical protein